MQAQASGVPLVIGVSGHRDPDPPALARMKRDFLSALDEIARRVPHAPLVLMNGLAVGCDRLAAEWAREWSVAQGPWRGGSRLAVVGVLAMSPKQFATVIGGDIPGGVERATHELTNALGGCEYWFVLPTGGREDMGNRPSSLGHSQGPHDSTARSAAYDQLASFLVAMSSVVIALWDGIDTQKPGGTASVVRRCRTGRCQHAQRAIGAVWLRRYSFVPHADSLLAISETHAAAGGRDVTALIVIPTPRVPIVVDVVPTGDGLPERNSSAPAAWIPSSADRILRTIEEFNVKLVAKSRAGPQPLEGSLIRVAEARAARIDQLAVATKLEFFGRARFSTLTACVGVSSFALVSSFTVQQDTTWGANFALGAEFAAALVLGYIALVGLTEVLRMGSAHRESAYWRVVPRAICQCIRVQVPLSQDGQGEFVGNWILAQHGESTARLRHILPAVCLELMATDCDVQLQRWRDRGHQGARERAGGLASRAWLVEQLKYFGDSGRSGSERSRWSRRVARARQWSARGLLLVALLLLCGLVLMALPQSILLDYIEVGLMSSVGCFLVAVMLIVVLAADLIEENSPDREDLASFARMSSVYRSALQWMDGSARGDGEHGGQEQLRAARAAAREAIFEVIEWMQRNGQEARPRTM